VITYVDTSTLLKRLLVEDGSEAADTIWTAADVLVSLVAVIAEARAALAAARRAERLTARELRYVKEGLAALIEELTLVEITEGIATAAGDIAEAEALRGCDAMHLATAIAVGATVFTSADTALCEAAQRRGLDVANPLGT
jgi:predicted nucleic acid-binding protein